MKPIIVRGGGDIATGTVCQLSRAGYPVLILETESPSAIRRQVAFCEAVYEGTASVEGITAVRADSLAEAMDTVSPLRPAVLADPKGDSIREIKPDVVVDAILAKRNLGTKRDMAELTIGLGPGFSAGMDVDYVIETMRGHNLGRIITDGPAMKDTGVPGLIMGFGKERVLHAPAEGLIYGRTEIAGQVKKGDLVAVIQPEDGRQVPVPASLDGIVRGLIRDGYPVQKGFKIADIDPRTEEKDNCFTISDKARCIGGSVLQLVCAREKGQLWR
ncbi:selenium-dependent molybdenum cofactor biosynthesis protein YqeB [Anaerostipes sp.]|uniref:selenium-dependent molybdenum cofactor biosynthesis protein YqeB n=1 Tax=Anaerostipes sp. TaxID=1872530 RepID=UPI0025C6D040|nr:selenium-dependent molybdenum cofactor biosynthesis protein YqeB [Anaerostipes sp.]MBS7007775.1 EF2563 family selenium-dependent molybdenum hydroxylase system protein [Anaerostipes sp.]